MAGSRVIERAREDIEAGRLWKARDRLTGAVGDRPHDAEALDLLGDVYRRMGDLPAAGRAWLLSGRAGPDADEALAALAERTPHPVDRLAQLGARAPLDRYPALARERISALREEVRRTGHDWAPRPAPGERRRDDAGYDEDGAWHGKLIVGLVVVLTLGVWLLGLATAVWLVVQAVW